MATRKIRNEDPAPYVATVHPINPSHADDLTVAAALEILSRRLRTPGAAMTCPNDLRAFCALHLAALEYESFGVLFLNAAHCLIEFRQMFRGTLTQTSVYPREVLREALALNAAAVILTHNHPSGNPEPSRADESITNALKTALALVDVRVLDHVIVAGTRSVSFAEMGLV